MSKKLFEHTAPKRDVTLVVPSKPIPVAPPGSDVEGRSRCKDGAALALLLTDRCGKKCPDCLYRARIADPVPDMQPEELKAWAPHLQGFRAVFLSGGEPTLHPHLGELTSIVKDLLHPAYVYLSTNGENITPWHSVARVVTFVNLTQHPYWTVAHRELLTLGAGVVLNSRRHWPWPTGPREALPCYRSGVRVLAGGRLYPCPGGPGISGAESVEVGPDCLERVRSCVRPCGPCPFGVVA